MGGECATDKHHFTGREAEGGGSCDQYFTDIKRQSVTFVIPGSTVCWWCIPLTGYYWCYFWFWTFSTRERNTPHVKWEWDLEEAELPLSSVFSYLFLHEEHHSPSDLKQLSYHLLWFCESGIQPDLGWAVHLLHFALLGILQWCSCWGQADLEEAS